MKKDSKWHEEKRQRCIASYSSQTKYKSVRDWRKRIAACGAKHSAIAEEVGIKAPRLSEYMGFLSEPSDERFSAIEAAIRDAENSLKNNSRIVL